MAPITLTVRDETTTGNTLATLDVQLEAEQVTIAELIRARVHVSFLRLVPLVGG